MQYFLLLPCQYCEFLCLLMFVNNILDTIYINMHIDMKCVYICGFWIGFLVSRFQALDKKRHISPKGCRCLHATQGGDIVKGWILLERFGRKLKVFSPRMKMDNCHCWCHFAWWFSPLLDVWMQNKSVCSDDLNHHGQQLFYRLDVQEPWL